MAYALSAILGISLLVTIHEFGHYLAARAFGMRVTRFSIGFGPVLARYQPKGSPTIFQIGLLPFLAYVQIAGMARDDEANSDDPGLYTNKGLIARAVTIIAGPLANYLTASLLVFVIAVTGWPEDKPAKPFIVARVEANSPAAVAGVKVDDKIVRVAGKPVETLDELITQTAPRSGQPTEYVIVRGDKELPPFTITPRSLEGRGVIGVAPKLKRTYVPTSAGKAALAALVFPWELTVAQLKGLAHLVQRRTTEGLTGPLGMGKMVAEQAEKGVREFLSILMLLSVALGMFNLLPFPALDGGRLVFLGYELVTRRQPNQRVEAMVHTVGLIVLLGMLVLVTLRDAVG